MRSFIQWYGGKGRVIKRLLEYVPLHEHYVEVFGGSGALLLAKPPCHGTETYNDLDSGLVNLFRVLKNPEKFNVFHRMISLTPYSRKEFEHSKKVYKDCESDIERACHFFIVARMSISGIFAGSWGYSVSSKHYAAPASRYMSAVNLLPQICDRLRTVQIECKDFRELIPRHTTLETLIYCDPPYLARTRSVNSVYRYEMSDEDHIELLNILIDYPQMVMLSSYANDIYTEHLQGWHCCTVSTSKRRLIPGHTGILPKELLWLNPLTWDTLHQDKQLNLF